MSLFKPKAEPAEEKPTPEIKAAPDEWKEAVVTLICWHEGLTEEQGVQVYRHLLDSSPFLIFGSVVADVRKAMETLGFGSGS